MSVEKVGQGSAQDSKTSARAGHGVQRRGKGDKEKEQGREARRRFADCNRGRRASSHSGIPDMARRNQQRPAPFGPGPRLPCLLSTEGDCLGSITGVQASRAPCSTRVTLEQEPI